MSKIDNFGDKRGIAAFKKGDPRINKQGRPKKLVGFINDELEAEGFDPVKPEHVKQAYLTICNLPYSRIKQMATDTQEDIPILYQLVAKEMLGKRGLEMLDKLLDRAVGKPTQTLEHNNKGNININISPDDAKL